MVEVLVEELEGCAYEVSGLTVMRAITALGGNAALGSCISENMSIGSLRNLHRSPPWRYQRKPEQTL